MIRFAEVIDAYRIIPRLILIGYMLAVGLAINWYFNFEVKYVTQCDSSVMKVLLDEGASIEQAESIACTVKDVIGQPTGYTALFSALVGAGAGIFGFYSATGRKWDIKNDS